MRLNKQSLKTSLLIGLFIAFNTVFAAECGTGGGGRQLVTDWVDKRLMRLEGKQFNNSESNGELNCVVQRDLIFGKREGDALSATYKMQCGNKAWASAVIDVEPRSTPSAAGGNYDGAFLLYEMLYLNGYDGVEEDLKDLNKSGHICFLPAGRIEFEGQVYVPV